MKLNVTNSPLKITKRLQNIILAEMKKAGRKTFQRGVVINFRDPTYSAETGGFHPVEIGIDDQGQIMYITDFAYVGSHYPELEKELDFAFEHSAFQQMGREYHISQGRGLFRIFQSNFCNYYDMDTFTQIEVSSLF